MATLGRWRWPGLAVLAVLAQLLVGCQGAGGRTAVTLVDGQLHGTTSGGLPFICTRVAGNLNNLVASVASGDRLVAMNGSGQLLSFDRATFRLEVQSLDRRATCLGQGPDGTVLAAMADGDIVRVDPKTLALTRIGHLDCAVDWVGAVPLPGGGLPHIIAVTWNVHGKGERWHGSPILPTVIDLTTGSIYGPRKEDKHWWETGSSGSHTYMVDSKGRLWIGTDAGEWGGGAFWFDLAAGRFHAVAYADPPLGIEARKGVIAEIRDSSENAALADQYAEELTGFGGNVYGFAELRDGRILILGGCLHMAASTYITEVRDGKAVILYERSEYDREPGEDEDKPLAWPRRRPADRPWLPITHIVQDVRVSDLTVFSYSDVFVTDPDFRTWEKVANLDVNYRPGRPDALGAYPAVQVVHPTPDGFILATSSDGYVTLSAGPCTSHALPDQLDVETISAISNTTIGMLIEDYHGRGVWLADDGRMRHVALAPPLDAGPGMHWSDIQTLLAADGSVWSMASTISDPVRRVVTRWQDGEATVLSDERLAAESYEEGKKPPAEAGESAWFTTNDEARASILASPAFVTPDGIVWRVGLGGRLYRLDAAGKWVVAGDRTEFGRMGGSLRAVSADGPPWIMLGKSRLWRMSVDAAGKADLQPVALPENEKAVDSLWAALPLTKDRLLVSMSSSSLLTLDLTTGKAAACDWVAPGQEVRSMCRDGLGRLWLAGEGLWMIEADGRTVHRIDLGETIYGDWFTAVTRDLDTPDTVLVAGRMMLLKVRVPQAGAGNPSRKEKGQ